MAGGQSHRYVKKSGSSMQPNRNTRTAKRLSKFFAVRPAWVQTYAPQYDPSWWLKLEMDMKHANMVASIPTGVSLAAIDRNGSIVIRCRIVSSESVNATKYLREGRT